MQFKVDGKKIEGFANYNLEKITKYLNKLPDGELLSAEELTKRSKLKSSNYLRDKMIKEYPQNFVKISKKIVFGNPKTIKALKDEIQG